MVATDSFEETMTSEVAEEKNKIVNVTEITEDGLPDEGTTESKKSLQQEFKDDRVFADIIRKLVDSQEKIEQLHESVDKIIKNKKLTAEQKRSAYMEHFNAAVLSFIRLPNELGRLCKTAKQRLWQSKERALKQIY